VEGEGWEKKWKRDGVDEVNGRRITKREDKKEWKGRASRGEKWGVERGEQE
jgi:hypothetical protein